MRKSPKAAIIASISLLTVSLGVSPALAADPNYDFAAVPEAQSNSSQSLVTKTELAANRSVEALTYYSLADFNSVTHSFDVQQAIATAKSELGTSRPTGWNAPGECLISAKRWITAGGGNWTGSGTPIHNYAGATRLPLSAAKAGDIIQYEYIGAPHAWATGVHTMLVTGVNSDGTLNIIQSNVPDGSGKVTEETHVTITPPKGFQAVVWRF